MCLLLGLCIELKNVLPNLALSLYVRLYVSPSTAKIQKSLFRCAHKFFIEIPNSQVRVAPAQKRFRSIEQT